MKNTALIAFVSGVFILASCSSEKAQPEAQQTTTAGAIRPAAERSDIHMAAEPVRKELTDIYKEYIGIKDALVKSDPSTAKTNANELIATLAFDAAALTAEERSEWDKQMQLLKTAATSIAATGDIEQQRKAFADLSAAMEATVRKLGLHGATVYRQYCPMAFDDQGGFWLAGEDEVNNPYFGDEMLHCGAVEDTLQF